jgi:hypothetical protein
MNARVSQESGRAPGEQLVVSRVAQARCNASVEFLTWTALFFTGSGASGGNSVTNEMPSATLAARADGDTPKVGGCFPPALHKEPFRLDFRTPDRHPAPARADLGLVRPGDAAGGLSSLLAPS